jgi:CHAT domain-containing protein
LANKEAGKGEPLARQAAEITRSHLELTAAVQSERQQLVMVATSRGYLDTYLSLATEVQAPAEEVYAVVLAWKGAVSARQQQLHLQRQRDQRPEVRKLYAQLQQSTARMAQLSHSSPDSEQSGRLERDLKQVSDEIEGLQRDLARLNEPFRQRLRQQRMKPADLRKALPEGTALVDLLEYEHYLRLSKGDGKVVRERRLIAFALRPDKPVVQLDLGSVQLIRHAVAAWRKSFGQDKPGMAGARQLRQFVWDRLEKQLGGMTTVLISPDGVLAKFPWAALAGRKRDTYLIEQYAIAVLPIPQQLSQLLQRPEAPAEDGASLLLVGDVDYGADPGRAGTGVAARTAPHGELTGRPGTWSSLSETRQEILAVRDSFEHRYTQGQAKLLRKGEATEEAVRQLAPRYRYLHFATHGFFAPEPLHPGLSVASRD